jgi:hypothetical protein
MKVRRDLPDRAEPQERQPYPPAFPGSVPEAAQFCKGIAIHTCLPAIDLDAGSRGLDSSTTLGPGNHELDPPAAATGAGEASVPIRDGHVEAVPRRHLARVGLDLAAAVSRHTTNQTLAADALPSVIGGPR